MVNLSPSIVILLFLETSPVQFETRVYSSVQNNCVKYAWLPYDSLTNLAIKTLVGGKYRYKKLCPSACPKYIRLIIIT
jgi:hypothetical protein